MLCVKSGLEASFLWYLHGNQYFVRLIDLEGVNGIQLTTATSLQ
jgi:hypothetical protein